MDKRGQELSTGTIILLILGVVILVVLVLGFSIGWNKVLPFISTNNVGTIQTSCSTACATNDVYSFCTLPRNLNNGTKNIPITCNNASGPLYGIEACSSIPCP